MKRHLCFLLMLMAFTVANAQTEICDNGIDDDGDGQIDCQDSACAFVSTCRPREICDNGIDDNNNGKIDYYDGDCYAQLVDPVRDSLALVALYNDTGGDNWTRNDNWLIGPMSTWYGVRLSKGTVYTLELEANNLDGELPFEANNLRGIYYFNFSDNDIHTIPPGFFDDSPIAHGHMGGTQLTFEDILTQNRYFAKLYDQQLTGIDTIVMLARGQDYTIRLDIDPEVTSSQYVWYKDEVAFDTTHINSYTLSNVNLDDVGTYMCRITNSEAVINLILRSHPTRIQVEDDRESQTIRFDTLNNSFIGDTVFLQASTSSGLSINFKVNGPAVLDDKYIATDTGGVNVTIQQLLLTDTGRVTVTAQQPGDSSHLPSPIITREFWVESRPEVPTSYSISGNIWQKENVPFQGGTVILYEVKLRYLAFYTQELKDSHTYRFDSLPKG